MTAKRFWIRGRLVDTQLGRLSGRSGTVHLEPQVMKVLAHLASKPRAVVTKDELMSESWAGGIASDAALARCISRIRTAFGDDARQPQVIETIPKIGYRLIADVRPAPDVAAQRGWRWILAAAASLAFAVIAASQYSAPSDTNAESGRDTPAYEAYRKGLDLYNKYTYAFNQNAIALFERALELDPDFGLAHAGLSDALVQEAYYWGGTRAAEGLRHAERAVELEPQRIESHRAMGKALAANSEESRALMAFRRAQQIDPDDWASALQRANLHFRRLEFDQAEAQYLLALRHAPNLDVAMSNLGYLYLKSGDVDAARHWFDRALDLYPLQQQAASRLAMLEMGTGQPELALARCDRLLRSYPRNYGCLQVLAVSRLMLDDLAGASEGFAKVLEAFPDDRYARLGQANVMLARSQQAEAFSLVGQVLAETNAKIAAGDVEAYDYWLAAGGNALLGDAGAAFEWLDRAAEAGRRFSLWDEIDPLFTNLRGDSGFDRYIAATRGNRSAH